MNNDLISRKALNKVFTEMAVNGAKSHTKAYARCISALELAPSVDAKPQDGCEWCQPNTDGEYSMLEFENPENPAQRAIVSFYNGMFAVELNLDKLIKPARISAEIKYCPFCGKKSESEGMS